MGNPLPTIPEDEFVDRLGVSVPELTSAGPGWARPDWAGLLWQHYEEMRRWNPKLSLIGPGTAGEVVERHYVESLRAIPLIDQPGIASRRRTLVDIGTGGGFPGLVLAVARADLDVVLVEPNQRKCAFLEAALRRIRKAAADSGEPHGPWSCRVLDARVGRPVDVSSGWPETAELVTSRALAWTPDIHQSLQDCWQGVRFLLWIGRELPELPSGAAATGRQIHLGSHRSILEIGTPREPLPHP